MTGGNNNHKKKAVGFGSKGGITKDEEIGSSPDGQTANRPGQPL